MMRLLLIALLLSFFALPAYGQTFTQINDVRFGGDAQKTRIVIDLSGEKKPTVFLLGSPERLVIDFPASSYKENGRVKPQGLVKNFRHGLFDQNTYRIVIDLSKSAVIGSEFALAPSGKFGHRYVVDLVPASQKTFAAAVTQSRKVIASKRAERPRSSPVRRTSGKKLIVVDPGHGGMDPGTLGVLGVNEEHIVLAISKEIKRALEATGRYTVHLTRDRDIYLPHRRRFEIARDKGADLFISVHSDSIANTKVRGGSVYTLNEAASDREAARLAARENKSDALAGVDLSEADDDVSGILIDLAQRQTMNTSASFAEILVSELRQEVRMLKRGHRFASLLVLKSPDVPSVLLETGFLTNKDDARMLNSKDGQRRIARGVLDAVDRFFAQRATAAR